MIGFGTDGIRGTAAQLSETVAYRAGLAIACFFGGGNFLIGRDTRPSGEALADALVCGICAGGGVCADLGIVTTPCVSLLTKLTGKSCGVMVTASHNPPEYNGIKVFDGEGLKLRREDERKIEELMLSTRPSARAVTRVRMEGGKDIYIDNITNDIRLGGVVVTLDCAHGSACGIAKEAFERAGAKVRVRNNIPDGRKINERCGALHPGKIKNADLGFAFDGDADRVVVCADGKILDGDSVLYTLSRNIALKDGVVVGTVMSNYALERALIAEGKKLLRTDVGDKFVSAVMKSGGYTLGGEQSGHYIVYPCSTGDGIFSALKMSEIYESGKVEVLDAVPQKSVSLFAETDLTKESVTQKLIDYYSRKGVRLVVRMSGTEPKVRIMAESDDIALVDRALKDFSSVLGGVR